MPNPLPDQPVEMDGEGREAGNPWDALGNGVGWGFGAETQTFFLAASGGDVEVGFDGVLIMIW